MTSTVDKTLGIIEALAAVLRSGRSEFNAQFAEAKRAHPDLDGGEFLEFLRTDVDALVRSVTQAKPDCAADVVMAAYEAGLELFAQKLAGPGARQGWVPESWRRVLPAVARLVADAPRRVLGAVSNAVHNLAITHSARADLWITEMQRLGPQAQDLDGFLRLGQVLGWRAGLAHYRAGAIAAADGLPGALALAAVGARSGEWSEIRQRLLADRWFDPAAPDAENRNGSLRVMKQEGSFRGYGGLFIEPPRVAASGDDFLVRSGADCWLLTADIFGATFHRSSPAEFEAAQQRSNLPPGLKVTDSKLTWQKERFEIASLGKFTSVAANASTIALTSELTHSVVLVAFNAQQK